MNGVYCAVDSSSLSVNLLDRASAYGPASGMKIYLIEDEVVLRDLCIEFFKTAMPQVEIAGFSGDGKDALRECLDLKPDLAVVDIRLPEINGLEILHILKSKIPGIKVLIFTATINPETIRIALHGKAEGFVEKSCGLEQLKEAIETILAGGTYYTPDVKRQMRSFGF